jgi:predicted AAA+ superfamily ATPase
MEREIEKYLKLWVKQKNRKVLLIRGARQVGKTYSVRKLGQSFKSYLEVNFEEHREIYTFFLSSLTPDKIIEKLSLYFQQPIIPGETLLFFDEIQAAPEAIRSLRFFYEKMPDLHLIAAGSLLEFAISEVPSFGVGRIESLFMYPMTFLEFLKAENSANLVKLIKKSGLFTPIEPAIHNKIIDYLKIYQLIGGLPEVINTYINTRDLMQCQEILDNLVLTFMDDFAKYRKKVPSDKLREVFYSIVSQAGGKFKYSNISNERSSTYKSALELLLMAGLSYKIYHTSARGLPLGSQIKENRFKIVMFDSGIYQRLSKLNLSEYAISDYNSIINKGKLAEIFVCNELIASGNPKLRSELFYWHREKRGSNAEIDYLISSKGNILPIEVKSGVGGKMQSLFLFLKERDLTTGIRVSGENFSQYDKIISIPAYAVSNLLGDINL